MHLFKYMNDGEESHILMLYNSRIEADRLDYN